MSYLNNRLRIYLEKNSCFTLESKTTSSIYYYFNNFSVRYSDHFSFKLHTKQYQVIKKAHGIFILEPGKEWTKRTDKSGVYYFRRRIKQDSRKEESKSNGEVKFFRYKQRRKESMKIKTILRGLKNKPVKTLIMNQI